MNLRYRYAIVSFCSDLTDSNATSSPLAVLLVGQSDADEVAVVVARKPPRGLDPISQAVIKDLVEVIKQHVDEAYAPSETMPDPADVIHSFEQSLRNSVHVSTISDELATTVPADDLMLKAIDTAMRVAAHAIGQRAPDEVPPSKPEPRSRLFDTRSWALTPPVHEAICPVSG